MGHERPDRGVAGILTLKRRAHLALFAVWKPLPYWLRHVAVSVFVPRAHVGAGMLITNEAGEVLLVRQTYVRAGQWALPGGWAKRGEEPRITAERETLEELGARVTAVRVLAVGRGTYGEVVVIFGSEDRLHVSRIVKNAEIAEARYFPSGALPHLVGRDDSLVQTAIEALRRSGGIPGRSG